MIEVMESLGHPRFFLAGHDRGARLSHRLCLDHPDRVMKLCLLTCCRTTMCGPMQQELGPQFMALAVHAQPSRSPRR